MIPCPDRSRIARRFAASSLMLSLVGLASLHADTPFGSQRELIPTEQSVHVRTREEGRSRNLPALPPAFRKPMEAKLAVRGTRAAAQTYTLSQLSAMSYTDMVNTLAGISWEDVSDLWTYSSSARSFYSDTYRVQALIDAIASRSSSFTATDTKGIPTLVEVVRAGFYHGWYHSTELPAMNDRNTHNKCLPAIRQAQANPNFNLSTTGGCEVITSMGLLISNGSCDPGIVRNFQNVLSQFSTNFETYAGDYARANAWSRVCTGIDYDLYELRNNGQTDPSALTEWYGQINYFLDEIFKVASKPLSSYNTNTAWAIEDALYYTSRAGRFHSTSSRPLQVLTDAMNTFGKNPWKFASARAAQMIHSEFKNVDYYGNTLDWAQIQKEIRAQYLPVTRTFDGGLFETEFGGAVSSEKMKTLIWAHKETKAQFFRTVGFDTPVDPNQTCDNRLKIVVYNTPDDYRMNSIVAGLDTANGGMYIEGDGTFYTYERTPAESIYSLEELFRHEGVHYLQGRYLVPGGWGASPYYDGNRLTWFEEGGAEWFAGATRTSSVKSRPTKTAYIPADLSTRMSISTLIHTGYGNWSFYDYGCNLMDYLNSSSHQDLHLQLASAIRAGNTASFDAIASGLTSYESAYQSHLTTLLNNSGTFQTPSTSADYLAAHPAKTMDVVKSEITTLTGLTGVTLATTKGDDWSTFTLKGTYTAGTSTGLLSDWTAMNNRTDGWLNTMTANSWSGYRTLTAYFTNYRKDASNRVQYDVAFHGVCTDASVQNNQTPKSIITAPAVGTPNQPITFDGTRSTDPDGTIVAYLWEFSDGTTATDATAVKTFAKPGTYTAKLTVTDNLGAKGMSEVSVKLEYTDFIKAEWESNNSIQDACGPVGGGVNVTGSLDASKDSQDYFFFDAKAEGQVTINLSVSGTASTTWQLFHESNPGTYVAYMIGTSTEVTIPANKTGRYYLLVYAYGTGTSTYTLNVTGSTSGGEAPVITTQPVDQRVAPGTRATFSVTATGQGLTYQWLRNGGAISGATSRSYTTPAVTTSDDGSRFSVTVTASSAKSVTSREAVLTVVSNALSIVTQPAPQAVEEGAKATFSVVASGQGLTYQWRKDGRDITGATQASYTTPACTLTDNGSRFTVLVKDASGNTLESSQAELTVSSSSTAPSVNLVITTTSGSALCNPNAKGSNLDRVTYWVDNNPAVEVTAAPFTYTINTSSMAAGSTHQVYCRLTNAAGMTADSGGWKSFTVVGGKDTEPPQVSVTAKVGTDGSVTYTANATDNVGVAKVIFYTDNWTTSNSDTTAPFSIKKTGLAKGGHYVLAEARDAAGNVAGTSWVRFVIP